MPVKNDIRKDLDREGVTREIKACEPSRVAKNKALALLVVGTLLVGGAGGVGAYLLGGPALNELLGQREWAPLAAAAAGGIAGGAVGAGVARGIGRRIEEEEVRPKVEEAASHIIERARVAGFILSEDEVKASIRDEIVYTIRNGYPNTEDYKGPYPAAYGATWMFINSLDKGLQRVKVQPAPYVQLKDGEVKRRLHEANGPNNRRLAAEYLYGFMQDTEFGQSKAGYRVRRELARRGLKSSHCDNRGRLQVVLTIGSPLAQALDPLGTINKGSKAKHGTK
jgi:hypothetical protein